MRDQERLRNVDDVAGAVHCRLTSGQRAAYESWLANRPEEYKAVDPSPVLVAMMKRAIIDASNYADADLKLYPQAVYDAALIHFIHAGMQAKKEGNGCDYLDPEQLGRFHTLQQAFRQRELWVGWADNDPETANQLTVEDDFGGDAIDDDSEECLEYVLYGEGDPHELADDFAALFRSVPTDQ